MGTKIYLHVRHKKIEYQLTPSGWVCLKNLTLSHKFFNVFRFFDKTILQFEELAALKKKNDSHKIFGSSNLGSPSQRKVTNRV